MATTKITSPDLFDLGSLNTALKLPSGTTAERPTSPSTGEWRYNTTTNLVEFWDGGAWRDLQSEDIPPTPSENFNTVLYNGTSATQSITGVGFQPDFVWIKRRDGDENHYWQDSSRGSTQQIYSNLTNAQFNETTGVTSFDSDGFTMGSYNGINNSGETYVAWCWKLNGGTTSSNTDGSITSTVQVNSKAGISIVEYTGTQANATVGHGLGVAPSLVITKALGAVNGWPTLVMAGSTRYDGLRLNEANLNNAGNGAAFFQNTSPTDSVFYLGNSDESNRNATATIAYCFAEVAGLTSIGGYSGNGSDNGPIINTGFEPAWLMIKVVTGTADGWFMVDNKRDTSNPRAVRVFANSNVGDAEEAGAQVDFLTNGFQLRGSGGGQGQTNKLGSTYVYIAFASDASAAPALADSFDILPYTGTGNNQTISGYGFNIANGSFLWVKSLNAANNWNQYDTIRGPLNRLVSNLTQAQDNLGGLDGFTSDGFTLRGGYDISQAYNYITYAWKTNIPAINTDGGIQSIVSANQAAGCSIVKWDGTGSASTVGHGLSAAPEIILTKRLNGTGDWYSFSVFANGGTTPANYFLKLNSSDAEILNTGSPPSVFAGTVPTATVFSVGTTLSGSSSDSYIAYCFTSISGFSKMGTYNGSGSDGNVVATGFEPSWVMIKRTNSTGGWLIFDSARNTSNPRNSRLEANNLQAEQAGSASKFVDFNATDFEANGSDSELNASGGTYLYMAFKENPTPQPLAGFMSFLVIAGGGGGGGNSNSGGAGAGGLRTSYGGNSGGGSASESNITLAAGTYTITVGAGGTTGQVLGGSGVASSIAASGLTTISSVGGGGGAGQTGNIAGANGGSGGGGGYNNQAGGSGTANQGFAGGSGSSSGDVPGGGGGGAGEAGNTDGTGHGGDGLSVEITGAAVFYAGGASGGVSGGGTQIPGSQGGGGAGAEGNNQAPVAGTTNLGSGGGGGAADTVGAAGGSGVVILRLATAEYSGTTTGSPTVTTDSTYTILTYTGSGTYVHS